jgi:hypothetical protein
MEFVLGELRSDPTLSFAELKEHAHRNGFEVFPILYGRAKAMLGLVPAKQGKPVAKATAGVLPGGVETAAPDSPEPRSPGRGRTLGPEMQFAVAALEKNPRATNREVKATAAEAGLTITPQLMLRARARLGLPSQRKAARDAATGATGAGLPAKSARTARPPTPARPDAGLLDLESLVASIREMEAERDRLRDTLERIVRIIEELT